MLTLVGALGFSACRGGDDPVDSAATPARPNVLLVTIDTLRADHAGGAFVEAPTLERLAAEGVSFGRAMATVPLTLPSHASMLTGQYPPTHGVRHNGVFELEAEATTLAERLGEAGYSTGAIVAASVLDRRFGLDQGFEHYDDAIGLAHRSNSGGYAERRAREVTDLATRWLEQADGPFFLWVHYYDPHADYAAPPPFDGLYPDSPYRGEVAYVDSELGRLVASLEVEGRLDDTVVAVTSDHGEGLGQHREGTHSYLIYDSVGHVPLLLRGPGIPRGRRVSDVVSNAAIAPTLLELVGAPPLPSTDVASLVPKWAEGAESDPEAWAYSESLAGRLDFGWAAIHGARANRLHYIRAPRPELFDTELDPAQLQNLLVDGPGDASKEWAPLAGALDDRIAGVVAGSVEAVPLAIDAEMRARIEALGYAVPSGATEETGEDPKDVHVHAANVHRALGHVVEGEWAEAEALARAALEAIPNSGQAHGALGRVEMARGRPDRALAHVEAAVRFHPQAADYRVQLGLVRLALRDVEAAVEAFEAAAEIDDEHPGVQLGLMWRLAAGAPVEEAEVHASRVLDLAPDPAQGLLSVASQWESLGEYERSIRSYREALERFPAQQDRAHMHLAILWARFGEDERAAAHRANAGALGDDAALATRLAVVYAARGELARAEEILLEQIELRPEDPIVRRHLATVRARNGAPAKLAEPRP